MCCSQGALTGIGTILFGLPASNIVHYPELFVWVSQEPFAGKEMERSLPKRRFHVPKEVNDKKINETNSVPLTPLGSNEPHSPSISYLHLFEWQHLHLCFIPCVGTDEVMVSHIGFLIFCVNHQVYEETMGL
ncbi:neuronal regeneration-related protein-like [Marmota marmota marmota]|uniref:Neuronal regeneration-related protein n=1 Tax=Marmota marmota marmota TaxID=9994 RepID=A0A8C6EQN4_MARMA|nr:neuronal regeneration-related protein-like [Marmota marmota marmota]